MRSTLASLALLPLLCLPSAARANSIDDISITNTAIGFDAEFSLPVSLTTDPNQYGSYFFSYGPVPGTFDGSPTIFTPAYYPYTGIFGPVTFGIGGANLEGFPQNTITYYPPTPYATLTLLPGSYVVAGNFNGGPYGGSRYFFDVTVTPESATITPEPPTLLLAGTALLASAMLLAARHRFLTRQRS